MAKPNWGGFASGLGRGLMAYAGMQNQREREEAAAERQLALQKALMDYGVQLKDAQDPKLEPGDTTGLQGPGITGEPLRGGVNPFPVAMRESTLGGILGSLAKADAWNQPRMGPVAGQQAQPTVRLGDVFPGAPQSIADVQYPEAEAALEWIRLNRKETGVQRETSPADQVKMLDLFYSYGPDNFSLLTHLGLLDDAMSTMDRSNVAGTSGNWDVASIVRNAGYELDIKTGPDGKITGVQLVGGGPEAGDWLKSVLTTGAAPGAKRIELTPEVLRAIAEGKDPFAKGDGGSRPAQRQGGGDLSDYDDLVR